MARLTVVAVFSALVGALGGAACGIHAADDVSSSENTRAPSGSAEPNPADSLEVTEVVEDVSEDVPQRDWIDRVADCLAWAESRNVPTAVNSRSGAAGLFQFLYGTWMSTPQGKAGYSRFDPVAARAATRWMINQGRLHEWSTWRMCA